MPRSASLTLPRALGTPLVAVQAALLLTYAVVSVAGLGTPWTRSALSSVLLLQVALVATHAAARAARVAAGRRRTGWRLVQGGCLGWAAAQVAWTWLDLSSSAPWDLLGVFGCGYASFCLLVTPGLWLLVPRGGRARVGSRLLALLDTLSLLGAVVVLAWALPLHHALETAAGWPTAFAIGDVGTATAVLVLLTVRSGSLTRPALLLAAGACAVVITDLAYLEGAVHGTYVTGTPLDLGWLLGFLLITAAARAAARSGARGRVVAGRRLLLLPYVPVVLAVLESGHQLLTEGPADRLVLGVAAALVALAFLRQLIALTHTADLLDALAAREGDLLRQARSDPLTGLGNRVSLLTRLDAALERRSRTGTDVVVLYVDLDDFKLINDTHGHAAGDQVLAEVGRRLAALAGPGDVVARLGGDEFALLLVGTTDPDAVAEQVLAALAEPVLLGSRRFAVRGSVGLVAAESPDDTSGLLMLHADIALYTAKQDGKGRVAAVRGEARQEAARRVRVRELVAHPDLAHFSVVYQPVVDLRDGRVRGVEALLRWQHPDVGAVPPDEFVPLAEQAGSIDVLGRFVLDTALADLAGWQASHPGRRLQVGVNVSPVQLSDAELLPAALAALARHGLGPDQLALELTEQAIVGDLDAAAAAVLAMREAGLSVAIDDFGTGWKLAALPRPVRGRPPQGRPVLRRVDHLRRAHPHAGALGRRPRPHAGPADDRGGRGDRGAPAAAAGDGLRARAGLPVLPAGAGRRDRRPARGGRPDAGRDRPARAPHPGALTRLQADRTTFMQSSRLCLKIS